MSDEERQARRDRLEVLQKDVDALYDLALRPGLASMTWQACKMLRNQATADLRLANKDRMLPLPTRVARACDRYNDPTDTVARTIWQEVLLPLLAALEESALQRVVA